MDKQKKIIVTGATGLIGKNLLLLLRVSGFQSITAIDKNVQTTDPLCKKLDNTTFIQADLADAGNWEHAFQNAAVLIILHAQITSLFYEEYIRNNVVATKNVLQAAQKYSIPYIIHVSSSVVHSVVQDAYSKTKISQEALVVDSGITYCILRPTLMFGLFDSKHFGWLSRFMEKSPIFPIPGHGKYLRQPLYSHDFCRIIVMALEKKPINCIYDIVGHESISYIDIIRLIKKIKKSKTILIKIPRGLFSFLLRCYAFFSKNPPFTAAQLMALTANDFFIGVDYIKEFGVSPTSLEKAFEETFSVVCE